MDTHVQNRGFVESHAVPDRARRLVSPLASLRRTIVTADGPTARRSESQWGTGRACHEKRLASDRALLALTERLTVVPTVDLGIPAEKA